MMIHRFHVYVSMINYITHSYNLEHSFTLEHQEQIRKNCTGKLHPVGTDLEMKDMRNKFEKRKIDGKTVTTKTKSKLYSKELKDRFPSRQRAKNIEDAVWRQKYCKGKIYLKHRTRLSCDVCGDPKNTQVWTEWCDVCETAFIPGKGKKSPQKEGTTKRKRKGRHDQCCIKCKAPYYKIKEMCKCK